MKDNTRQTLKYYWNEVNRYRAVVFLVLITVIIKSFLGSIIPLYFRDFFNVLAGNDQNKEIVSEALFSILLVIAILSLGEWLFRRIADFSLAYLESKVMAGLNNKCFSYLHRHSFSYFSNNFTGSLVKKVKSFNNAFEVLADQSFETLMMLVEILVMVVILAGLNIFLGLGMLFWIVIFLAVNWFFTKYKIKYDIERSKAETATSGFLADTVSNNINLKLFNGEEKEDEGFIGLNEKLHKIRLFSWNLANKFYGLQAFLLVVLEVGMLYFAIGLWKKDALTAGDFILIESYIMSVVMMVWNFGRVINRVYERLAEAEEMTIVLNTPHEINDRVGSRDLEVNFGRVKFDRVNFAYEKGKEVLKGFSLEIRPGQTVALVGLSGSGKSTLVKLLLRLHDIQKGKILIDEQDISRVTQESLRRQVSLVPQDPILFHRSLMENIRYGRFEATDKEVIEASKLAYCDEFISKLHDGYGTFVGERGIKLSGGERQRVAIARAVLKNAPILVLDEATSSLDSESEKYIQEALDNLIKNKTVIIIAHRLSTIKKADRIVVLEKGRVIEDGNHSQLIKRRKGVYKHFWDIQVGGFIQE